MVAYQSGLEVQHKTVFLQSGTVQETVWLGDLSVARLVPRVITESKKVGLSVLGNACNVRLGREREYWGIRTGTGALLSPSPLANLAAQ
jgi:hypothetical protein